MSGSRRAERLESRTWNLSVDFGGENRRPRPAESVKTDAREAGAAAPGESENRATSGTEVHSVAAASALDVRKSKAQFARARRCRSVVRGRAGETAQLHQHLAVPACRRLFPRPSACCETSRDATTVPHDRRSRGGESEKTERRPASKAEQSRLVISGWAMSRAQPITCARVNKSRDRRSVAIRQL